MSNMGHCKVISDAGTILMPKFCMKIDEILKGNLFL